MLPAMFGTLPGTAILKGWRELGGQIVSGARLARSAMCRPAFGASKWSVTKGDPCPYHEGAAP